MALRPSKHLTVWLISDQRPGHVSQLEGLAGQLRQQYHSKLEWFNVDKLPYQWKKGLPRKKSSYRKQGPDIVIGAGHKTHKALLMTAKLYEAFSVVLMKPSLPISWFDAVICPQHDGVEQSQRVMTTFGVLNKNTPQTDLSTKKDKASLMLIGGPSKHFQWQEERLLEQVTEVCNKAPAHAWSLMDSPRTPASFTAQLTERNINNLSIHPYKRAAKTELQKQMQKSDYIWVTPDSMSMIYESLTLGTPTSLFDLPLTKPKHPNRINRNIALLIEQNHVSHFEAWKKGERVQGPKEPIWEAKRAAGWLVERYTHTMSTRSMLIKNNHD